MIDEDGNRYYVYDLERLEFQNGWNTISSKEAFTQVIGYKDEDGYIVTLPFGRIVFPWDKQGIYNELKTQKAYYVAEYPKEIYEFADILGEKANEIRLTKTEILELSIKFFEYKEKKKINYNSKDKKDDEKYYKDPVLIQIYPIKNGEYKNDACYFSVGHYFTDFQKDGINYCKTIDGGEFPIYTTTDIKNGEVVSWIQPLEYYVDEPKEVYSYTELKEIEKKLNNELLEERKKKKEEDIKKLAEQIKQEREEKKKAKEEEQRRLEEEKKLKEAQEAQKKKLEEEQRLKKEKRDKIIGAPKRAINKFNKRREDNIKKQYEVFKKIAGENPHKIETLEQGLEEDKKLQDSKNQLKKEINEIRKVILDNLDRLSELDDELDKAESKVIRVRIPEKELILKVNGRREINPIYLPHLKHIDFSTIDSKNLKVSGIYWDQTNISIDPQKVYKKDLSGCKFGDHNITWKSFKGCNLQNCDLGDEKESTELEEALIDEDTKLPNTDSNHELTR